MSALAASRHKPPRWRGDGSFAMRDSSTTCARRRNPTCARQRPAGYRGPRRRGRLLARVCALAVSVTAKSVDDGAFGQLEIGPVPKLAEQRASCSAVVIASPLRSVLRRVIVIAESGRDDE